MRDERLFLARMIAFYFIAGDNNDRKVMNHVGHVIYRIIIADIFVVDEKRAVYP